jgi:hypothetical protein
MGRISVCFMCRYLGLLTLYRLNTIGYTPYNCADPTGSARFIMGWVCAPVVGFYAGECALFRICW